MHTMKEKAANVAASAKSGMDKTKATVQEKVERLTANHPTEKAMATEKKNEKINQAEWNKQEAREHNAAAKQANKATAAEGYAYSTTGVPGHATGGHHMSALPGHGTGQPAGKIVEGTVGAHPTGFPGHATGGHQMSALPGHGTGQPAGKIVEGTVGAHPTGFPGHATGGHQMSALPGHGTGQPAGNIVEGTVGALPTETARPSVAHNTRAGHSPFV